MAVKKITSPKNYLLARVFYVESFTLETITFTTNGKPQIQCPD